MDPLVDYAADVEQSEAAMRSDYYNNQAPMSAAPACIPTVPRDAEGNQLIPLDEGRFKYIELDFGHGDVRLAILTPWTVQNGPGKKYRAREER